MPNQESKDATPRKQTGAETKGFFWRIAPAGGVRADDAITETAEIRKAEAKPNALQMQFNNLSNAPDVRHRK
jgi:hypothetical protein